MTVKQHYVSNNWAIGSDDLQWVLSYKREDGSWKNRIFIRTDREILARCMRDLNVPDEDALFLLYSLPETFNEWKATYPTPDKNNAPRKLQTPLKGILND